MKHIMNCSLAFLGHGNISSHVVDNTTGNLTDGYLSEDQVECLLNQHKQKDGGGSNFDPATQAALIMAFGVLILFGATGNGLVCYVVARNCHMRTPRNIFIINLAISDLTLCLFTQPSNLLKVSMQEWKLGAFMCKFVPMFAGTNVFVSTISITAIALDRFQVIVYPTKDSMKKVGAAVALLSIWIISFLMASPLLIFSISQPIRVDDVELFTTCWENPNLQYEKAAYSIASMIFQYIVPIVIVTVAHARICNKLKYRMINQNVTLGANSPFQQRKNEREAKRKRKTNLLLVMIAVVFACSYMPLNVFNIIADFNLNLINTIDKHGLVFPICHLLVLSSACANPVLYGWLNDNFRREFVSVLSFPCCQRLSGCCRRPLLPGRQSSRSNDETTGTTLALYARTTNGNATCTQSFLTAENPQSEPHSSFPNTTATSSTNVNSL